MNARELIVDGFAGGGGASRGIELALGRGPDLAYNHDAVALAMHRMNHPSTRHVCRNIMLIDPLAEVEHRPVGLAWFAAALIAANYVPIANAPRPVDPAFFSLVAAE